MTSNGIAADTPEPALEPLPYHVEVRDYLKSRERELWNWFAKGNLSAEGLSHPEAFIRARALALWQEQRGDAATLSGLFAN